MNIQDFYPNALIFQVIKSSWFCIWDQTVRSSLPFSHDQVEKEASYGRSTKIVGEN
jgi:hypothetical protein